MKSFAVLALIVAAAVLPMAAVGQTALDVESDRPMRVGTMHSPPFIVKNADGSWSGVTLELWRRVAIELGLRFELEERDIQGLLSGVQDGSLDAAVAALTITEGREVLLDFTHPFHTTGFSVAVPPQLRTDAWWSTLGNLLSWQFFQVVGLLAILLFLVGWIIWLVEHKQQIARGDSHTIRHISEGFWWAAATMTTVGYGDKTPLTRLGRLVGVVWMFMALMLVAGFIAAFSSALTVNRLESQWRSPQDLTRVFVATVPASTSEGYLKERGIASRAYPTVAEGLRAVADGEVDAMVYDAPLIRYLVRSQYPKRLEVLPFTFERQDYGFALPAGSALREPINRALIRIIREPAWTTTLDRYLGN